MVERLLSGADWILSLDPSGEGRARGWMREPHPNAQPASVPGCVEETFPDAGAADAWYWKTFQFEEFAQRSRHELQFDGVDFFAEAWLNGQYLGGCESALLPFAFDAASALQTGENLLAVRVVKAKPQPAADADPPLNDPPWNFASRFRYSGIYQDVRLVSKRLQWIEDAFIRPNLSDSSVDVWIEVADREGIQEPLTLEAFVSPAFPEAGEPIARARKAADVGVGKQRGRLSIFLSKERLRRWEIHDACLYRLDIALMRGKETIDRWSERFGMREFGFNGSHITLNGRPLLIRGLLYNQVWQVTIGRPFPKMAERDIELAREAGANLVRVYSKSPYKAVLDACDEKGVMAQAETLAASYLSKGTAFERARRLEQIMTRQVMRDRNRASVFGWRVLNEADGELIANAAQQLLPKLRALDPTRLIVNADSASPDEWIQWLPNEPAPKKQFVQRRMQAERGGETKVESAAAVMSERRRAMRGREFMEEADPQALPFYLSEWGVPHGSDWDTLLWDYNKFEHRLEDYETLRSLISHHREQYAELKLEERGFRTFKAFINAGKFAAAKRYEEYLTALWGNPNALGYCLLSLEDSGHSLSGVVDIWRREKAGSFQKIRELNSKKFLNVDLQPRSLYENDPINIDVTLVNEQEIKPGPYALNLSLDTAAQPEIWGVNHNIHIDEELIQPLFADSIPGSFVEGDHRLTANIRAIYGPPETPPTAAGKCDLTVYSRELSPKRIPNNLAVWEENDELTRLLRRAGIRARPIASPEDVQPGTVFAVSKNTLRPDEQPIWNAILERWRKGAPLAVLDHRFFAEGDDPTAHFPAMDGWKPDPRQSPDQFGRHDFGAARFALSHPLLEGLPDKCAVGSKDAYARICPSDSWTIHNRPPSVQCDPAVLRANIERFEPYTADVCILKHGPTQILLSTFRIAEHLHRDPGADRLALNMLTAF